MRPFVRLMCLACVVIAATTPGRGQQRMDISELQIPHKKFVLDNGLTLLVHQDHSVPIVAVNVWYHVGSRDERRGKTGFAHLFEHFFFNGSENYPHGFREAMDDIGANNRNGTTNTDRTNFFEDVPVSGLERTLFLESDRMGFLAGYISEDMLERERGVVQNEKRQGENRPYGKVFGRIVEAVYPYSHPYSWSTIGSLEDLEAAGLDDIRKWYASYYGPNNCILSLAGDITYERALELVTKYFGAIPPGPPVPAYRSWVPTLERNLRDVMPDRVPQARIYRVYHIPGWGEPEMQRLELAGSVLSGSKSARLDRALVYDKQVATSVSALVWDKEIAGNFFVILTVKPGVDPAQAEREMDAVLSEFLEKGPTDAELQRARSRSVAGFVRGTERLGGFGGRSDILAESMIFGGDPEAYMARLEVLTRASAAEVRRTSRRWLDAKHYTLTVVPFPELKAEAEDVDRSVVPALGEPPRVRFPEVKSARLDNGLEVRLLERGGTPIVNMTLAVDAGFAADPIEKAGVAALTLQLLEEGTESRDAFRIVDELDAQGAFIETDNSLDLSFVRLRALKMNLAASMDVFADVVLHPAFPEEMVAINKKRQLAQIEQEKAQPRAAALRLAPKLLYGETHAYSKPLTGSGYERTVEPLAPADLAAWHGGWFLPNNATLIVAGDIEMKELMTEVERVFGSWKRGEAPEKNIADVESIEAKRVYLIDKPDAPQSVIVAAHVSRRGGQDEDLAIETVMRLFGGMSTSRLNRNLRLDKHWSYGVRGSLVDARGQRPFAVVAPVQTDKTKESILELIKEIEGIAGERPVQGEEFESIKRNMVLRLPGRFETLSDLEEAAEGMLNYGYPAEYYYDYADNVLQLSEQDLRAAASKFIAPHKLTWIVIGDLSLVEAGIRELQLGEIVHMDADGRLVERTASVR